MQQESKIYEQAANLVMEYTNTHTVRFETPKAEIISLLNGFKEKFAPEVLKALSDDELLNYMFLTVDGNNESLCYHLEFNSQIKKTFGSISGGSSFKFGLFQRQEDGNWTTGAPKTPRVLSDDEALQFGKTIRDNLVKACEMIQSRTLDSVEAYEKLDDDLNTLMGKFASYAWVQKYLHMIFPEQFIGWYITDWLRHILLGLGVKPSDKYYGMNGQLALIKKRTIYMSPDFQDICYAMFGEIRHFYRLASSDESEYYAEKWKEKNIVAIGWKETGDLLNYIKNGTLDKDKLAEALSTQYYHNDKKTASRKAIEMKSFYETSASSVITVMDGSHLIAFVDSLSPYFYDQSENMAHQKSGVWHSWFDESDGLPEDEDYLTTCNEIKKTDNLMYLYKKYYWSNGTQNPVHGVSSSDSEDSGNAENSTMLSENKHICKYEEYKELDLDDRKQVFMNWMATLVKAEGRGYKGKPYSSSTITNYANGLKYDPGKLASFARENKNLFFYTELDEFAEIIKEIKADPNYDEVNKNRISGGFSCALDRYAEFLIYLHSGEVVEEETEVEPIMKNCLEIKLNPRATKRFPLNCIIYGAPGTGKTYITAEYALAVIEDRDLDKSRKDDAARRTVMDTYKNYVRDGRVVFTTFHQSYGYEEFIQGLRPDTESETMSFRTEDGVFKKIADRALNDGDNRYVIIIDEINRANISKVFGELITLIEDDKRWGEVNETCATLQSGDVFAVPNNLYIVGTMNSADKSISLIDAALRRRFEFFEQYPDADLIDDADLKAVFVKLNELLADSLESSDLLIGHSYFMGKTKADLPAIMNHAIIPLLYEYFYDNKKKVISVLKDALKDIDIIVKDSKISRVWVEEKTEA